MKFSDLPPYQLDGAFLKSGLAALLAFALVLIGIYLFKIIFLRRLVRLKDVKSAKMVDLARDLVQDMHFVFVLSVALYAGLGVLGLSGGIVFLLERLIFIVVFAQIGRWASRFIDFGVMQRLVVQRDDRDNAARATTLHAVSLVLRIALWVLIILLILENATGVSMGVLITSMGIVGVAVALAVQGILGDLFASLSIALDKPFVIGDLITVGEFSGTVEYIGLKSTRLRSISGEELVFSNSDVLSSRLRNFGRMERRRGLSKLTVPYNTRREKLDLIPQILQESIEVCENTTFGRAHLKTLGDWAVEYEYMYYVNSADYIVFMDAQHRINLEVLRRFAEAGIEFASPPSYQASETQA